MHISHATISYLFDANGTKWLVQVNRFSCNAWFKQLSKTASEDITDTLAASRNTHVAKVERIDWAVINEASNWEPYSSSDEITDPQYFPPPTNTQWVGQRDLKIRMVEQQRLFELLFQTAIRNKHILRNQHPRTLIVELLDEPGTMIRPEHKGYP